MDVIKIPGASLFDSILVYEDNQKIVLYFLKYDDIGILSEKYNLRTYWRKYIEYSDDGTIVSRLNLVRIKDLMTSTQIITNLILNRNVSVFKSNLPMCLKEKCSTSGFWHALIYEAEILTLTKKVVTKTRVAQWAMEGRTLGISLKDRIQTKKYGLSQS